MKNNKETLKGAMDRRLSFLDDLPSCRAGLLRRIAQEEEPVMKKKLSFGLVFAMVLVLLSVAALAAGLLLSSGASAARTADRALEETCGITAEMQTFFFREEEELPDGSVRVTYTGVASLKYVLGTYTAVVRNGKAEISWNRDGEVTSGGYDSDAWGPEQLKRMMADSASETAKRAFMNRAAEIAAAHGFPAEDEPAEDGGASESSEEYHERREAEKTAALNARRLSEEEMTEIGRSFVTGAYGLNEEQISRLELYTNSFDAEENCWYEMVNGKPCFLVEYLLYQDPEAEQPGNGETRDRSEKDGYYKVFVNVETGVVEQYEYNSALGGEG